MAKRPKYEVRVAHTARRDVAIALDWSLKEFGESAALRYAALIAQALADLAEDPERPGSQRRSELAEGIMVYHLRHSRDRGTKALGSVKHPRHVLIYRRQHPLIEIIRVLHDARELWRHLPEEYRS